jgi:hypothetical protein
VSAEARTARILASVALALALLALVVAGYALSLEQERTEELRELSESVRRAIDGRMHGGTGPPPGLDDSE